MEFLTILVSEDRKMIAAYYNLKGNTCLLVEDNFEEKPNPFSERFTLEDFDGLTDDEILDMVKEKYVDAGQYYEFDMNSAHDNNMWVGTSIMDYNEYSKFGAIRFPSEISYDGELDATGNKYEDETLYLYEGGGIKAYFYFNSSAESESLSNEFQIDGIIEPSVIKSKEYVGLESKHDQFLVTENTYTSFGDVELDNP